MGCGSSSAASAKTPPPQNPAFKEGTVIKVIGDHIGKSANYEAEFLTGKL